MYLSEPPDDTGRYAVTIADTSHPVLRGLGDFGLHDELYANMPMKDDVKALAILDGKGVAWPSVARADEFGKGEVFTPLGHHFESPIAPIGSGTGAPAN